MDKFSIIANGWKNYLFPSRNIKVLAENRAKICAKCPFTVEAMITLPDTSQVKGLKCSKCSCPSLSVVVMAENRKCPEHKW